MKQSVIHSEISKMSIKELEAINLKINKQLELASKASAIAKEQELSNNLMKIPVMELDKLVRQLELISDELETEEGDNEHELQIEMPVDLVYVIQFNGRNFTADTDINDLEINDREFLNFDVETVPEVKKHLSQVNKQWEDINKNIKRLADKYKTSQYYIWNYIDRNNQFEQYDSDDF